MNLSPVIHLPGHRKQDSIVVIAEIEAVQPITDDYNKAVVIVKSGRQYKTTLYPTEVIEEMKKAVQGVTPKLPKTDPGIVEGYKPRGSTKRKA